MNFQTFSVTVVAPPALEPPQMKCVEVLPNGNALLRWSQPVTPAEDSLDSFRFRLPKENNLVKIVDLNKYCKARENVISTDDVSWRKMDSDIPCYECGK